LSVTPLTPTANNQPIRALPQVMVTAVAQCGVDVNAAAAHPWRNPALQFVPGLGPRKAAALVKAVARNGNMLESRCALY